MIPHVSCLVELDVPAHGACVSTQTKVASAAFVSSSSGVCISIAPTTAFRFILLQILTIDNHVTDSQVINTSEYHLHLTFAAANHQQWQHYEYHQ